MDLTIELRLKRLMLFRVVMITTLLLIAIYVETVSETLLPVNPLYFLIGATYLLTVFYALALRSGRGLVPQVYFQLLADLLVITGLVYVAGGVRAGFMLLYPIPALAGSAIIGRRGSVVLAGVATLLYAGTLWAVRANPVPARGWPDVLFMPAEAPGLLDLRHRGGLRDGGPHRLLSLGGPASRGAEARGGRGRGGRPQGAEPAHREQHPERAHDHGRFPPRPLRQPVRGGDPGPAGRRGAGPAPRRALRFVAARAPARGGPPDPDQARDPLPSAQRGRHGPGHLDDPPRLRSARRRGTPPGLPGPDGRQAAGGGGADQGEAGRGRRDGRPSGARDPQPPGLDQRLRAGPHGRRRRVSRAVAPSRDHGPRIEAPLGRPQSLPLPGPDRAPATLAGGSPDRCSPRRCPC